MVPLLMTRRIPTASFLLKLIFLSACCQLSDSFTALTIRQQQQPRQCPTFQLAAKPSTSLKPAAVPLMDAGKALARTGELLIDWTSNESVDIYGGAWSAAGAQIRNAGDCVAQAAASCRFKTGAELVCDELREAGTCLTEGSKKLQLAQMESLTDEWPTVAQQAELAQTSVESCGVHLEAAGAAILQGAGMPIVGQRLAAAGADLENLSELLQILGEPQMHKRAGEARQGGQRCVYAAEQMILAGNNLQGIANAKAGGGNWMKQGGGP